MSYNIELDMVPEAPRGRHDRKRAMIEAERFPVDVLAYAGGSKRRISALRQALPNIPVIIPIPGERLVLPNKPFIIPVSGGKEPDSQDPMDVVRVKVANGTKNLRDLGYIAPGKRVAVIAADTLNSPLSIYSGNTVIEARRKPEESESVRETFEEMAYIARNTGTPPFYVISSAAGLERYPAEPGRGIYKPMSSTIFLNPEMLEYLGTEEGFKNYLADFKRHHEGVAFSNQGEIDPMSVTDVTAGFSLATLTKMGAVDEIDMVPSTNPEAFRPVLYDALYTAYVGIEPTVLRPLQPDAAARIKNWPWLNEITDEIMATAA